MGSIKHHRDIESMLLKIQLLLASLSFSLPKPSLFSLFHHHNPNTHTILPNTHIKNQPCLLFCTSVYISSEIPSAVTLCCRIASPKLIFCLREMVGNFPNRAQNLQTSLGWHTQHLAKRTKKYPSSAQIQSQELKRAVNHQQSWESKAQSSGHIQYYENILECCNVSMYSK